MALRVWELNGGQQRVRFLRRNWDSTTWLSRNYTPCDKFLWAKCKAFTPNSAKINFKLADSIGCLLDYFQSTAYIFIACLTWLASGVCAWWRYEYSGPTWLASGVCVFVCVWWRYDEYSGPTWLASGVCAWWRYDEYSGLRCRSNSSSRSWKQHNRHETMAWYNSDRAKSLWKCCHMDSIFNRLACRVGNFMRIVLRWPAPYCYDKNIAWS